MQSIPVTNSQRKTWNKQTVIFLFDVALFFILLNTLPFEPAANKGLSPDILSFVPNGVLYKTAHKKMHNANPINMPR